MLHPKVNQQLQCLYSKEVRIQSWLYPNRVTKSFHCCHHVLVMITASTPSQNTHSQKRAYWAIMDHIELADGVQTDSWSHHFTLPSTLKNTEEDLIFIVQSDTPLHDIETCGENMYSNWARLKRREWRMKRIRKHAELLVKLKIAIHQAHEVNLDKSGKHIHWRPINWRKAQLKKRTEILLLF